MDADERDDVSTAGKFCTDQLFLKQTTAMLLFVGKRGVAWVTGTVVEGGVRVCSNFHLNSRYCGFKILSGLRLLQPLSRGFW